MSNQLIRIPAIELAVSRAPGMPLAALEYQYGTFTTHRSRALKLPYIELNPGDHCSIIPFDVDERGGAFNWERAGLPPPTWSTTNPRTGNAHLVYVLETPVLRCSEASSRPVRLLSAVQRTMRRLLGADAGYHSRLTQNPLSDCWLTIAVDKTYTLNELCEYLPQLDPPRRSHSGVALGVGGESNGAHEFDLLRAYGYKNWALVVAECAAQGQSSSLRGFAASIDGIHLRKLGRNWLDHTCARIERWMLDHHNPDRYAHSLEYQRRAQARGAVAKRNHSAAKVIAAVSTLRAEGLPVNQSTVAVRRGVNRTSICKLYKDLLMTV